MNTSLCLLQMGPHYHFVKIQINGTLSCQTFYTQSSTDVRASKVGEMSTKRLYVYQKILLMCWNNSGRPHQMF